MRNRMIGLLGGMSWESSLEYYRIINQAMRARRGGVHSARILMWSGDFGEIERLQHAGDWPALAAMLGEAAAGLEHGGAELLLICTNTMHRLADEIAAAVRIPLLHIADPTADAVRAAGVTRVGLLGTEFTMRGDFYKGRLAVRHGLEVVVPDAADRAVVHAIIYEELVAGIVRDESRARMTAVIRRLADAGATAVILGCTELMLLVGAADSPVPIFDTTALHAHAAVAAALADQAYTDRIPAAG